MAVVTRLDPPGDRQGLPEVGRIGVRADEGALKLGRQVLIGFAGSILAAYPANRPDTR